MAGQLGPFKIPYPQEGIIRSGEISDALRAEGSIQLAINFNFDSIGAIQSRKGISQIIAGSSGPVISFAGYAQNASNVRRLLYQIGTDVFSWDGATSTNVRTLASNNKGRFVQFTDLMYMVNGVSGGDNIQSFNGTAFSSTNIGALTKGDLIEVYEGRLWVADIAADKLYFTDVIDTSQTITGGTEFLFKLSYSNGQKMTALKTVPRALLMFRTDSIYRVYSGGDNASADSYPVSSNVGTYSQESIVTAKDGFYFHHSSGFYKFNIDSQPTEISRRVSDIVNAISRSEYENIHGWQDGNHIYWFVGDLTLAEGNFSNCVMRYTISTEMWTVYSYKDELTASVVYDDATNIYPVVGVGATGIVGKFGSGNTDLGQDIVCEYITGMFFVSELYSQAKELSRVAVAHENAGGFSIGYKVDKQLKNEWTTIGTLEDGFVRPITVKDSKTFNRISFRLAGSTNGEPVYIYSIDVLDSDLVGIKQP